jgi:hypothetical protein
MRPAGRDRPLRGMPSHHQGWGWEGRREYANEKSEAVKLCQCVQDAHAPVYRRHAYVCNFMRDVSRVKCRSRGTIRHACKSRLLYRRRRI